MKKFFSYLILGGTIGFFILSIYGCSAGKKTTDDFASTAPNDDPEKAAQDVSPLYFELKTNYEKVEGATLFQRCYIPKGTTASGTGSTIECKIQIPELQLYYSDLTFTIGSANPETCRNVTFIPYYYVRSTSAVFKPGATEYDCSKALSPTSDTPKQCFGGSAVALAPGFPLNSGVYILPAYESKASYVLKSANSLRQSTTDMAYNDNTASCNNLASASRGTAIPSYYAGGGAYRDYSVTCYDEWYKLLYRINLTISDEDTPATTSTPAADEVYDWGD